jgi:dTDP-4-amino-4,6-dideoxygalactose transaminase
MWARTQLKIGWGDLLTGGLACLLPGDRAALAGKVERYFTNAPNVLAAYSVRSGFDLLLQALKIREGDEVLFSALNIRGMVTIARRAGAVPVPVDLDIAPMAPSLERLEAALTPKSRVLVVAHLFGTRLDMQPIVDFARRHYLILVEDCAQAFNGRDFCGHPDSDLALFSFGPLKTATALGGALIVVRDADLRARMRSIQSTYPVQKNPNQLKRIFQFSALKIITSRWVMGLIFRFFKARNQDYEDAISDNVRNVAPLGKARQRRYQPSAGMLALMHRRLGNFVEGSLESRAAMGRKLRDLLDGSIVLPAQGTNYHDYWVFPVLVDEPGIFIKRLRENGFDGANLPRSQAVPAPDYAEHLTPKTAAQMLADMVVVPCYPGMPEREIQRQAELLRQIAAEVGTARTKSYANMVPGDSTLVAAGQHRHGN